MKSSFNIMVKSSALPVYIFQRPFESTDRK